jgi:hypothetical protein
MSQRPGPCTLPYLRDGVPNLTVAEQESALRSAGISLEGAYCDRLNATQLKRREPGSLRQRARLLDAAASAAPAVLCVAGLRCLGWNMADIARTLAVAGRQGLDVRMVDMGVTFNAAELNARLLEALADADETWRRGQTEDGRSASTVAVMAKAEAARRAKLEAARPLWAKPPGEISGAEIARTVGVSLRSLNNWLGPRGNARGQGQSPTRKGS